ncbi:MAG: ribosome maturation factor RimM [Gemmiger sp.]|nr:ribosome maturation factor RimM [Gemmiger sp.]
MQNYLPACKIVTTHGVRGEMKATPLCDGAEFLKTIHTLYAGQDATKPYTLEGVRPQGTVLLLTLAEVGDMDAARAMVGKTLYFARADANLPEGRYFVEDVIGCAVRDAATGAEYGKITAVDTAGAQDLYTVTAPDGAAHLLPAVPAFIDTMDIAGGVVLVTPIPGLFGEPTEGDRE